LSAQGALLFIETSMKPNPSHANERGVSIILFTVLCVVVIIPVIGLAIDGSMLFWAKAKLTSALDAAALAAGRSPSSDPTTVAKQYVYANLPPGWLGTSYLTIPTAFPDHPSSGTRRVTVSATIQVPLHFMRILGIPNSSVSSAASSTRRNTNVMLVLDRSGSMQIIGPDGNMVCDTMKASAETFVNFFTDGQDQVGLISFNAWAHVDFDLATNFQSANPNLNSILSDLTCGSNTASAQGLDLAYQRIKSLGSSAYASAGALNVILFMTDGFPNGVTVGPTANPKSNYTPKSQTDDRYCVSNTAAICYGTPATPAACQSSLSSAAAGTIAQEAGGTAGFPNTGTTAGFWQVYPYPSLPPTSQCASGNWRSICNSSVPVVAANSNCNYIKSGSSYIRNDLAYIPTVDLYGNATVNTSYMTQSSDLVQTGPYAGLGHRVDIPIAVMDASFNSADAEALKIIQDTTFAPVIYVIGLGGAADVASEDSFLRFLHRVANDSTSDRYNPNLPVGLFVYSPDDTQLQSAFRQVASQILRLSK